MTRSTLHSVLYREPSESLKQQNTMLMQMLHSTVEWLPTETSVPAVSCSSKHAPSSASFHDPYISRVYWVLINHHGQYLADIQGLDVVWVDSLNEIPTHHRYGYEGALQRWKQLRNLLAIEEEGITIRPFTFYAHRSTPFLWCASDD